MSLLVERDHGVELLDLMFRDCNDGQGGILLVSGPAATGKSELLHSFAEKLLQANVRVMSATAARSEQALRFAVLAQLFQPFARSPEHREQVSWLLRSGACATALSGGPGEATELACARVFHELWSLLDRESARQPVVILVEDVQYADESSVRGLLFLARRLQFARVLMVFTEQTGAHYRQHSLFHSDLFRQSHCRRLRLGPLTASGVAQLLTEKIGAEEARGLVGEVLEATGGNPLLVRSLLDDRFGAGRPASCDSPAPAGGGAFGEALVTCLHRLEPPALNVATMVAVLGECSTPERIAALLGADPETVRRCGEILDVTGVLHGWQFRHGAAGPAVLGRISPEERHDLYYRAAELLYGEAVPRETVSRLLLAAGAPLPEWTVDVLHDTAKEALFGERGDEAVRYLELAHASCRDAGKRSALVALLAVLEWRTDPSTPSRRFPLLGHALRRGQLSRRDAGVFVRLLLWHGDLAEAEAVLERYFELPASDDRAAASETRFLRTWLAHFYPRLAHRFKIDSAPEQLHAAVGDDPLDQAADLLATVMSDDFGEAATSQAQQLLERHELHDTTLEPLTSALTALLYADHSRLAAKWCDALLGQAAARRAPTWQAVLSGNRGEIALRQGDLRLARSYARDALTHVPLDRWGVSSGLPLAVLLRAATEMGDLGEASRVVRQPVPQSVLEGRFGVHYLQARGHYYLARGWPHTARNDFLLCGELVTEWGIDLPMLVLWRLDLAEAYLNLGRPDRARALVEEQLERTVPRHARARGMALRLLAATGEPADRPPLLTEAVDLLAASEDLLELARTLTDLTLAHEAVGETGHAGPIARRARELAIRCHAEPLVQRVPWAESEQPVGLPVGGMAFGGIDERDDDPTSALSGSERRVAALAAQGHTNQQIARRLFITVSTVEQHLTSTYRKLGINRRADLPSNLALLAVDSM
ncbi:AAA family ATPase [Streptomyces sp. NPDC007851]|uniref:helix-turn-helix transcriptional regulator n=1 Tax=Streptomyces sp. NPDC007851 TaxID=3155008 RepID=UPI0033F09E81